MAKSRNLPSSVQEVRSIEQQHAVVKQQRETDDFTATTTTTTSTSTTYNHGLSSQPFQAVTKRQLFYRRSVLLL